MNACVLRAITFMPSDGGGYGRQVSTVDVYKKMHSGAFTRRKTLDIIESRSEA